MTAWEQLRKVAGDVRKRWPSRAADSYFQYKRRRERERKQAEHGRVDAERSAEQERKEAERGREYAERYRAERTAAEPQVEAPQDDTSKPEGPR